MLIAAAHCSDSALGGLPHTHIASASTPSDIAPTASSSGPSGGAGRGGLGRELGLAALEKAEYGVVVLIGSTQDGAGGTH